MNLLLFEKEKKEYDNFLNLDWTFGEKGTKCFKNHLIKENSCAFVAEDDEKIVGYLVGGESKVEDYRNTLKMAELDNMFVLEEYRGKSAGGMLYDAFVKWCKGRGSSC